MMKPGTITKIIFPFLLCVLILPSLLHASPDVTRIITLHPGWNSIFLDVQPEDTAPKNVFAALPEDSSVWCWLTRDSRVEYIQHPSEGLWNQPGWIGYFKSPTKEFLSNLYAIFAGKPYLIFVAGSEDVTLPITGTPSVERLQWEPDSFNLVGFSNCSENSITVGQYFSPSTAHAGQAIYQLDSNGQWQLITEPDTTYLQPGIAYWVYCEGASTYQGPLEITFPSREGLDFSEGIVQRKLILHNLSDTTKTISIIHPPAEVVLTYKFFDENTGTFRYPDINTMPAISLEPGAQKTVKLCVRREAMAPGEAGSILGIIDDGGTAVAVPIWVDRDWETTDMLVVPNSIALGSVTMTNGLWVGTATLDKVSKANRRGTDFLFDMQIIGRKDGQLIVGEDDSWISRTGEPTSAAWRTEADPDSFDDSSWTDPAPTSGQVTGTAYFRKTFTPPAGPGRNFTDLLFTLQADDGAAVYVNGTLIHSHNLAALDYAAPALVEVAGDPDILEFSVPATLLQTGNNLIAVEVHQHTTGTDDLVFNLELRAALTDILMPFGPTGWSYYDLGTAPPDDGDSNQWQDNGYSTNTDWQVPDPTDPDAFQYDLNEQTTSNPHGLNPEANTIYFRRSFTPAALDYDSYTAQLVYDDGVVFYHNGVEDPAIHRLNMPQEDPVEYDTHPLAVRRANEKRQVAEITLDTPLGNENILAVEVHQHPTEIGGSSEDENAPVPTNAPLDLRLLLHLDSNATPRLLKEVLIMSREDENGERLPVLLTDHTKIPEYDGVAWRDGVQVARRLSTVGFDFDDEDSAIPGSKVMEIPEGVDNALTCVIDLACDHPTNPFLHRYHPDHDNFNARYDAIDEDDPCAAGEVPTISRAITLSFDQEWTGENIDGKPPGWGRSFLEGEYQEVITGLHKNIVTVQGIFRLHRVSEDGVLNP